MDMATVSQDQIVSTGSTATLDLREILSTHPDEPILSTRFSLPSIAELSIAPEDVPPFPSRRKPLIFIHDIGTSLLLSQLRLSSTASPTDSGISRPLITSPTGPRLKVMLIEKISIQAWTVRVFFTSLDICINHLHLGICISRSRHSFHDRDMSRN